MYVRISQGRRALGFTIDWLASYAIAYGLFTKGADASARIEASRPLTILVLVVEYVILVSLTGSSFGHRVVGLQVIDFASGQRARFLQVVIRVALLLPVITAVTFDDNGRGINERFSKTALARR